MADDAHDAPAHDDHGPTVRAYLTVFIALAVFTLVSFLANYAVKPSYQVSVHLNIGFGDETFAIPLAVTPTHARGGDPVVTPIEPSPIPVDVCVASSQEGTPASGVVAWPAGPTLMKLVGSIASAPGSVIVSGKSMSFRSR